ncbi:MAG: hypothetical protein KC502_09070 [Myxococcales bacterium]|nr:hypothetical protein [Myxococcales bacterium]
MTPLQPCRSQSQMRAVAGLVALALLGCGQDETKTEKDAGPGKDGFVFVQPDISVDGGAPPDSGAADDAPQTDSAATDTGPGTAAAVTLALPEKLGLGTGTTPIIKMVQSDGSKTTPTADDEVVFVVDGVVQTGAGLGAEGKTQPAVAAWTFGGKRTVVGARAGTASVVVKVNGLASEPAKVQVTYPTSMGVIAVTADAAGLTTASRTADLPNTVQLKGKTIGAGGLTASLRFPTSASTGDKLDLSKPPTDGALKLTVSFADLGGASAKMAQGYLWIDQTEKGLFRGSFLGRTAQLKPVAGVFVVQREGKFGIDLLDETQQIAKSDGLLPVTGDHYSRVSLTATDDGKAVLYARHISNGLKAHLVRWQVDPKTGKVTPLPAMIENANAYEGTPDKKAPAFGRVVRASHGSVAIELWEGRDGKGATKPHRLYVRLVDAADKVIGKPVAISTDLCSGGCKPAVALLPSTRFAVMWSAPDGVKIRRVRGQPSSGEVDFVDAEPLVIGKGGKDGVIATHSFNVLAGWYDPDKGPVWRHYLDKTSGKLSALLPAQAVGASSTKAPRQVLAAMTTPSGAPNLLFVSTWLDFAPGGKLTQRRLGLDGTPFGLSAPVADVDADAIWGQTGLPGQLALLSRSAKGTLTLRKLMFESFKAPGTALGGPVTMLPSATYPVVPAMVYLKSANIWVLAWAGDESSPGIFIRRFR